MNSNVRAALLNPMSDITTIFYAALAALDYDLAALSLDFEAVSLDVASELGQPLPLTNLVKLETACKIAFTDLVYQDEGEFNDAALVTQSPEAPPNPQYWEPIEVEDAAWLMIEAYLIDPPADESRVAQTTAGNHFMARRDDKEDKPSPMEYSDQVWKYCGSLLSLEGATRPISTLPKAIMPAVEVDANMDPDLYASFSQRNESIEQDVASYVVERMERLLPQLQKLPTSTGEPLLTAQQSAEWLSQLKGDLLKSQSNESSSESAEPDQASSFR